MALDVDAAPAGPAPGLSAAPEPAAPAAPSTVCHVIVRAANDEERDLAQRVLRDAGLTPHEVWSTATAVSFAVGTDRPEKVRTALEHASFGWAVVAPGEPDYLIHRLLVEGPDGRRFGITDAPAQQLTRDVANDVVAEYDPVFHQATMPTVIDQIQPDGQGRRLDPEATLHDSGIRDGDRLRVGFETRAGAVNPLDRQDALYRVRNQILAYAESRPGISVMTDSALLPTEFEIDFAQPGFGPPSTPGGEPVRIERHTVRISCSADFPETAPRVYWLTPVFHPNVFPNYDCEEARVDPGAQGLVCLGLLAESYQPSLDFGDLCQLLVDMAGFRNYSLFESTGELQADGTPRLRANFYDRQAARWVAEHQDRIEEINGSLVEPVVRDHRPYPNVVEPLDGR
ncbi:hypothetical protein GCM10009639_24400 [Kitasatospora putterlickiae]|uniref:UBC core domain-containing protein n=1 Tax=Kitasatospora putterlickiae TaxID=221725 RepID=A0ABN1XXP1_9ACTN